MKILRNIVCKVSNLDTAEIEHNGFPSLYYAANKYSANQQTLFYLLLGAQLLFLLVAAGISVLGPSTIWLAVLQLLLFAFAFSAALWSYIAKPDRHWYSARAIAESVKTSAWRYSVRAEPFNEAEMVDRQRFATVLGEIVSQNRDVAKRFTSDLRGEQITELMDGLRASDFAQRKNQYIEGRVVNQQNWYAEKCEANSCAALRSFVLLALFIALAGALAISRIWFLEMEIWPTDLVVTLASSMIAWSQSKRYSELSASYSLAANEISIIRSQGVMVDDEDGLSTFVANAENAFSREHTQWAAKKEL